jgi:hypothetical protein
MRHDSGLAASLPLRDTLEVGEGRKYSSFACLLETQKPFAK